MADKVSNANGAAGNRDGSSVPDKGPIGLALSLLGQLVGFHLLGLTLAIVIEWIGMIWWWPGTGMEHAQLMMKREISFLSEDFRSSLFASHPAVFARECADFTYHWLFEWTGFSSGIQWLRAPVEDSGSFRGQVHGIYLAIEPYILAGMTMTETYALRVAVLVMSIPVFLLFSVVGMADGLMRRDLRRWGGGRESSLAHGTARAMLKPLFVLPWLIYLSLPVSVHPNWIILPSATCAGIAMCVMSATFKKYL